jgi:hypothetical protein
LVVAPVAQPDFDRTRPQNDACDITPDQVSAAAKSRGRLKEAIDSLRMTPRLNPLIADRIIVPRIDKLPVILRIWTCSGETQGEAEGARHKRDNAKTPIRGDRTNRPQPETNRSASPPREKSRTLENRGLRLRR